MKELQLWSKPWYRCGDVSKEWVSNPKSVSSKERRNSGSLPFTQVYTASTGSFSSGHSDCGRYDGLIKDSFLEKLSSSIGSISMYLLSVSCRSSFGSFQKLGSDLGSTFHSIVSILFSRLEIFLTSSSISSWNSANNMVLAASVSPKFCSAAVFWFSVS